MKVETDRGVIEAPERLLNLILLASSKAASFYSESDEELLYKDMFSLSQRIFFALEKGGYYDTL